jgi:hypothetical protein
MGINQNSVDFQVFKSDREKALHYKILTHYSDRDISGKADMFLKNLIHYKSQKCQNCCSVYRDCLENSLKNDDIIGHLKFFYPNGYNFRPENMRHGVGQITLDHIIEDLLEVNGKMLYVFSTTQFMENFLNKHHFKHSSRFEFQYYLYL